MNLKRIAVWAVSGVILPVVAIASPLYNPVGPQKNVAIATVLSGGWSLCYSGGYGLSVPMSTVLGRCGGDRLMLAGGVNQSDVLELLAQAPTADVLTVTAQNVVHNANGSGWYYNSASMGFAPQGFAISQNTADTNSAPGFGSVGDDGTERLSWHTGGPGGAPTMLNGGWRVGNTTFLNSEPTRYTRYIFTATGDVPEPTMIMLLGSAAMGVAARRLRRKS